MITPETCPFCRADLYLHCASKACTWLECREDEQGCGATRDPRHHVSVRRGVRVEWPGRPDAEPELGAE